MELLRQVGEDEPLPVPRQAVLRTEGGEAQAAPRLSGLQQEVDLRVVAQRLIVAHPLRRGGDGLPVDDAPGAEVHLHPEAGGDEGAQDLQLDLSHELEMDLLEALVPEDVELGVLLRQELELVQRRVGVHKGPALAVLRQEEAVAEHRLQVRRGGGGLGPQPLSGEGAIEARDGADGPRRGLLHRSELTAGVDADLLHLLLPAALPLPAGEEGLHPQSAASDLQMGQTGPLSRIAADLEDLGGELRRVHRPGAPAGQALQQGLHPLQLQRRAEIAGEHLPPGHQARESAVGEGPGVQVLGKSLLAGGGGVLEEGIRAEV